MFGGGAFWECDTESIIRKTSSQQIGKRFYLSSGLVIRISIFVERFEPFKLPTRQFFAAQRCRESIPIFSCLCGSSCNLQILFQFLFLFSCLCGSSSSGIDHSKKLPLFSCLCGSSFELCGHGVQIVAFQLPMRQFITKLSQEEHKIQLVT